MKRALVAAAASVGMIFAGGQGAYAHTPDTAENRDADTSASQPTGPEREAAPLLDPVIIALCNAGLGETVIDTAESQDDGDIDFKCGDDGFGYVHIRGEHEGDWETRKGGEEGLWDDYMWWATKSALENPSFTLDMGDNKRCYTAPIAVSDGQYFHPTIIVSMNNKHLITSYPTSEHECVP
jgi:hypothetical protein